MPFCYVDKGRRDECILHAVAVFCSEWLQKQSQSIYGVHVTKSEKCLGGAFTGPSGLVC